jgi:heat shock protein HtpX
MNFLEAQAKNKRETIGLIFLFVLLCTLGGTGVDATLMAGIGNAWFSIFGMIALAFLVPLWIAKFLVKIVWSLRNPGAVDEFGYEQESSWVPLHLCLVPLIGGAAMLVIWNVSRGASFTILGIIEAKQGVISTTFPIATLVGFLIGGGEAWWASRHSERAILALSKTRRPDPQDLVEKQLLNVVAEMAVAAGISTPDVLILKDRDPNAFAVASVGSSGTIVATWGLVQALTREEMQAVIGHEMAHLRNRDTQVMTLVSVLFGSMTVIATWARRGSSLSIGRASSLLLAPVWIFFGLLSVIVSRFLGLAVSRNREYLADATAVELCRNPEALIGALTKIDADPLPTWNVVRSVAHQCIADPLGSAVNASESWWSDLFATHPPMKNRLLALRAMAYTS